MEKNTVTNSVGEKQLKITREPMPYGRILIVDDMKSSLDIAILLMKPYRLNIETAAGGFEALELIKGGGVYDIIFMDHMMPRIDGMETTRQIRALGYTGPVIALTANTVPGQQEIFLANGFDAFISKPISIHELNGILNKFVRDRKGN